MAQMADKIRKILAKALDSGCTTEEAASLMAKVQAASGYTQPDYG